MRFARRMFSMKQVYSARDEADAQMIKNALMTPRSKASFREADSAPCWVAIPVTAETLPSVWVRDDDVEPARRAINEFQHPPAPTGPQWKCPKCGEVIDPQFTACWNCGTARPQDG